jgi:hypothetical protein
MRQPFDGGERAPFVDPRGTGAHSTLPYREATELLRCIEIMGPESSAVCRHAVLGEPVPPRFPFDRRFPAGSGVETAGGGATAFEETVRSAPTRTGDVIEGDVDRREFIPGTGGAADTEISAGTAHVRFDTAACAVTLPYRFFFQQQNTSNSAQICQDPPSATAVDPLPRTQMDALADRYVAAVNAGLADWFTVRLAGCEHPCAGRDLPVRPEASRVTSGAAADTVITVVPRGGRGDAATICARAFSGGFAAHEGGHQVLGLGDEFLETDPALLARMPAWGRQERVRTDFSMMNDSHSRFSVFHTRHFRHVPTFLEAALAGCTASLQQAPRSLPLEFRIALGGGYATTTFGRGGYFGVGFDIGLTGDRMRAFTAYLGAHARLLDVADESQRLALMAGLRVSLEHRWSASTGGPRLGGFAEGGALAGLTGFGPGVPAAPYAEAGLTAGWSFGLPGLDVGAEIAGGVAEPLRAPAPGPSDPPPAWLRFGLTVGGSF